MTERHCHELQSRVEEVVVLGGGGFRVRVALDQALREPLDGGHFFMLRTEDPRFPFLSRPFSVHDTAPGPGGPLLDFVLKVVGPGTRCLAELQPDSVLELVGPLGQPFPYGSPDVHTLLVAGGVGLPPLHLYLRRRAESGRPEPCTVLYGARHREQLFALDSLEHLGIAVKTATEDGSHGRAGRVDALLSEELEARRGAPVRVLTCGPDPMMARVAELCQAAGVPCLASLETLMACGFGVCNACAVPYAEDAEPGYRYARACMDGPVMDAARVLWHHDPTT